MILDELPKHQQEIIKKTSKELDIDELDVLVRLIDKSIFMSRNNVLLAELEQEEHLKD